MRNPKGEQVIVDRRLDFLARAALALLAAVLLASCSGAVSGPPPVTDPSRITILPADATLYSGIATTFVISGGTGSYIVSSNNQAIIPVSGSIPTGTLIVVPNPVITDTQVTLTVRDTGSTPTASTTVTVRPGTVNNTITITPTATQGGNCSPAICSGGDAEVAATLSQGGIPLPARGVRFDVISGAFRFITAEPPAVPAEVLATTATTITDETGRARIRIRVLANAPNQTAILQVTDLGSGAFQRTSFIIAQATGGSPGFFVVPDSVTFTGPRQGVCASNVSSQFFIFGGVPPYRISNTAPGFFITRETVAESGGSFLVTALGFCAVAQIGITDSAGRTITVTVTNQEGTAPAPELVVSPDTLALNSCAAVASATVVGGTGQYLQPSSGSASVLATIGNNTLTVRRLSPSGPTTSPVLIGVSDGTSAKTVTVNLTANALGACPSSVTLQNCTTAETIDLGTGVFTAPTSNSTSVIATVAGTILTVRRVVPSLAFTPPATITVPENSTPTTGARTISVIATGTGAAACP